MSCDLEGRPNGQDSRLWVSIARRRLVVLRRMDDRRVGLPEPRFNRPKAISCLATDRLPSRRLCRPGSFNRPKAISCLATMALVVGMLPAVARFNRPKAISCLATPLLRVEQPYRSFVSIARRRLVVLRLVMPALAPTPTISFNRPKAISCLATHEFHGSQMGARASFNRPKAISCLATRSYMQALTSDGVFQSPEGD